MNRELLVKDIIDRLARFPSPFDSHYGVIPIPPSEEYVVLGEATQVHQEAMNSISKIDALVEELIDPYIVSRVLSRQEAVHSSKIEGTNSTLNELLYLEEGDQKSNARPVIAYANALERHLPQAKNNKEEYFTTDLICDLHQWIAQNDPDCRGKPGFIRDKVVWIGGTGNIAYSTYNPTPPQNIQSCLIENVAYLRKEGMGSLCQSIVTRMALSHLHFEAIHPFEDGNGRTGRLLLPLMMAAEGHVPIYLSSYIEANKQEYYDSLKEGQQRNKRLPMISYISNAIKKSVEEVMVTRSALKELEKKWKQRAHSREGSTAYKALSLLPHYPVLTTKRLAELLNVSIPAASRGIQQLKIDGIIKEKTGYQRNRIFVAEEALLILNRPFGEAPAI